MQELVRVRDGGFASMSSARARLLTVACLLVCIAVVCRGFVVQPTPLDALASVDPRLGGVDGLGVLDTGRKQQLSNVDYMQDHRDMVDRAEARIPRHTRSGSVWSGLDDSDGHLPFVNVNAWGATKNHDGVRWPHAPRRMHSLRHVYNPDGVLSRIPSQRSPDVLERARPNSNVDGVLARLEDNLDDTKAAENRLSHEAYSGPLSSVPGSSNPDGVLARTPQVAVKEPHIGEQNLLNNIPGNDRAGGVLSRFPVRSGVVVPSDAQVLWDSEGVLNHMAEDPAATNGVLGGKLYASDEANTGGSLFVHGLGSDETWKAAVHDDGWNTKASSANSGGALSQVQDGPAGGALSLVHGSDAGGSLSAVKGSNAGGSLLRLSSNSNSGGVLARTAREKGSSISISKHPEDVEGSLSVSRVKDQKELVDGSIAAAKGKYGSGGTLSRALGKEMQDGVLAGKSSRRMADGALFSATGDDMAAGALSKVAGDEMANGALMAVKNKQQQGGWLARFESHDAGSHPAVRSVKEKKNAHKHKSAMKEAEVTAAKQAMMKAQVASAKPAVAPGRAKKSSSAITEVQKKHAESRGRKHRIHQLAEGDEEGEEDAEEDEETDEKDTDDIGWIKHRWGLGTWVMYIFFAPIFTAVTVAIVGHYAGSVAAICAFIILFTMDISCYYYSWFLY